MLALPVVVDHPEQVLEPPRLPVLAPERVALEVEEDVAAVRLRQRRQALGIDDLELDVMGPLRFVALHPELQLRLQAKTVEGCGSDAIDRPAALRQLVDRRDPDRGEAGPLVDVEPADEQHVAGPVDLGLALGAASAGCDARGAPLDGLLVLQARVDQRTQPRHPLTEHRADVFEPVVGRSSVPEQQVHRRADRDPARFELLCVGGELEEGGDLRPARELRVVDLPLVADPDEEVREAEEGAVEEGRLEDDVRAVAHRLQRRLACGLEGHEVGGVLRPRDLRHAARGAGDVLTELVDVRLQLPFFVPIAETGGPPVHRVLGLGHRLDAVELRVELAHERPLALGSRLQV